MDTIWFCKIMLHNLLELWIFRFLETIQCSSLIERDFVETAEALAGQVTQEHYDKGMIYPPFTNIRKISAHIAANVAAKAYELGS